MADQEEISIEDTITLITERLGPALEEMEKRVAANVQAAVHDKFVVFQREIDSREKKHHAENRLRLQSLDAELRSVKEQAENNGEQAKDTDVKVTAMAVKTDLLFGSNGSDGMMGRIENKIDGFREMMMDAVGLIRESDGKKAGKAEADSKREQSKKERGLLIRWILGLVTSSGIGAWLTKHFHWLK